jgi:nitrous oxide reductase
VPRNSIFLHLKPLGVDREKLKVAGDVYSIPTMIANKGDNVTVHFYNLETEPTGRHSFTIGASYNIDKETIGGQSAVVSFIADHEGVFRYYCKFHTPEMRGQLMVVP